MFFRMKRDESMLPPNPDNKYIIPTRTANCNNSWVYLDIMRFSLPNRHLKLRLCVMLSNQNQIIIDKIRLYTQKVQENIFIVKVIHWAPASFRNKKRNIPKPNCCSIRIPMNTRLSMLATRWITPACNQIQVKSLHPWCLCSTLSQSKAPIFSNLQNHEKVMHCSNCKGFEGGGGKKTQTVRERAICHNKVGQWKRHTFSVV